MWTDSWVYERIALCIFSEEDKHAILEADKPYIELIIGDQADTFHFKRAVEEEDIDNFPSSTFYKLSDNKKFLDIFKKRKFVTCYNQSNNQGEHNDINN